MNTRRILLLALLPVILEASLHAFSPYEACLNSSQPKQVGLLAQVPPDQREAVHQLIEGILDPANQAQMSQCGIRNTTAFTRDIGGNTWIVVHFVLDGGQDYLQAARLFEEATKANRSLTAKILPHPRATRFGTTWLQMEWINYIRGKDITGPATSELMIVTTILPDKEAEYRSLHQTVWPGVVDQVIRSSNRDLCIFLAEIDNLLVEFLYVEYVGKDKERDDAMSQSDVINHRWWKLTDACQKGLPGVEGNWVEMTQIQGKKTAS